MSERCAFLALALLACCILHFGDAAIKAIVDDVNAAVAPNDRHNRSARRSSTHTFREKAVFTAHPDFSETGAALSTQYHDVVFVVKQNNVDELKQLLLEVSDPFDAKYGKHMTSDEIAAITANPKSHKVILEYVKSIGAVIVSESQYEDHVTARAPLGVWEKTFDTKFQIYSHNPNSRSDMGSLNGEKNLEFVRSKEYSIPSFLDEHVSFVLNTVQIPMANSHAIRPKEFDVPPDRLALPNAPILGKGGIINGFISPGRIVQTYNIDINSGDVRATQLVFETKDEYYSPRDLTLFQRFFELPLQSVNQLNDPRAQSPKYCERTGNCQEGNLDLQWIMGIGKSPTKFGYTNLEMGFYLKELFDSGKPPLVISISYGIEEKYVLRLSQTTFFELQAVRLGLMGVTILVAAGDNGVTSTFSKANATNCGYSPSYPATCPYVTAVGATQVSGIKLLPLSYR